MDQAGIDLEGEQRSTLARPRYDYSSVTRTMVRGMDAMAGAENTVFKARIVETLAPIPYRAWENREYGRLSRHYGDDALVREADSVLRWGREAQDNEYQHLRVIGVKLREDEDRGLLRLSRTGAGPHGRIVGARVPCACAGVHASLVPPQRRGRGPRRALLRGAGPGASRVGGAAGDQRRGRADYGEFGSWADVFRRIGLDERDHRNASFAFAGMPELIGSYEGMPETPGRERRAT